MVRIYIKGYGIYNNNIAFNNLVLYKYIFFKHMILDFILFFVGLFAIAACVGRICYEEGMDME